MKTFDVQEIEGHGWRQGSVLGPSLLRLVRERAPTGVTVADEDWLIVTSHDCDVLNSQLEKEPAVELLRGELVSRSASTKQLVWGRNPRVLELEVEESSGAVIVLSMNVHQRWTLPREVLSHEPPARLLAVPAAAKKEAGWASKRNEIESYQRFDADWVSFADDSPMMAAAADMTS